MTFIRRLPLVLGLEPFPALAGEQQPGHAWLEVDEISQEWLIRFLEHRIGDRRIIRLIRKCLKAGILEDGIVSVSGRERGRGR
jgi:hypothetical protein